MSRFSMVAALLTWSLFSCGAVGALGQTDSSTTPQLASRILNPIDERDRVMLKGNVHPLAKVEADHGPLSSNQELDQMVLALRLDPQRQVKLSAFLTALQDKSNPKYHHFLSPERFGDAFGASTDDIAAIADWLSSQGFRVDSVPEGRRTLIFSGTAGQVESAFHTSFRRYRVAGEMHFANAIDPEIPAALALVVEGIVSLHDFRAEAMHVETQPVPEHTTGSFHYLAPADFSTIYNLGPLYRQGINGSSESIAIVARSNVDLSDVRSFRSTFGLPPKDPRLVFPGHDPGKGSSSDQAEATLDAEWAGGVAPSATILLVPVASTGGSDGAFLSAQYIVNKALAPILSMSFAECESALGAAGNSAYHSLWQQAAAEGITVLVSSGDSGAAGCDLPSSSSATLGAGVNGICSTPDATCVGGTEFEDTSYPSLYWASADGAGRTSALGYVPEMAWNESAGTSIVEPSGFSLGSGLHSTGGGRSRLYAKPPWQAGVGVPVDGRRDVPDLALAAAAHDGYLVQLNGKTQVFSGTSVAVASFAGMLALIEQNAGTSEGGINAKLYNLAGHPSIPPAFHDVTSGNNSVPGPYGYAASTGYDMVTGLGSLDGQALLSAWNTNAVPPTLTIGISPGSIRLLSGSTAWALVTLTSSEGSNFGAPVKLGVLGMPAGVVARYLPASLSRPGTGTLVLAATRGTQPGIYAVEATASPSDGSPAIAVSFTLRILSQRGLHPHEATP